MRSDKNLYMIFSLCGMAIAAMLIGAVFILTGCGDSDQPVAQPVELVNPKITADLNGVVTVDKIVQGVNVKIVPVTPLSIELLDFGVFLDRDKQAENEAAFREANNIPEGEKVTTPDVWLYWRIWGDATNNTEEDYIPSEWYVIFNGRKLTARAETIPTRIRPGQTVKFFFATEPTLTPRQKVDWTYEIVFAAPEIR